MLLKDILVFFEENKCDEIKQNDAYTVKEIAAFKRLNSANPPMNGPINTTNAKENTT